MAALGLLQGFGRGLSQTAGMLQQGMSEDRAVELQRMREESIERRWKRQEEREDARNKVADDRYADQVKRQEKLDNIAASESAAQQKYREDTLALQRDELSVKISERRRAEIEGALGGIQREYEKDADALERRYEQIIDRAKQLDQQNGFAKDKDGYTETDKAYMARDKALASLSSEFTAKMVPFVRSYGAELKGTAYSSYLDDVKAEEARQKEGAGKVDVNGQSLDQQPQVKSGGRGDLVNGIVGSGGNAKPVVDTAQSKQQLQPGFSAGFSSMGMNSSASPDLSDASPLEAGLTRVGQAARAVTDSASQNLNLGMGLLSMYNQNLIQPAVDWLTTKPSQQPFPGETPQQYAARTGIKR